MCPQYKLAKHILKNKIFFLPTNPYILEHVSRNTDILLKVMLNTIKSINYLPVLALSWI
jgi:archaellum biogenesis ATPase FlaH